MGAIGRQRMFESKMSGNSPTYGLEHAAAAQASGNSPTNGKDEG